MLQFFQRFGLSGCSCAIASFGLLSNSTAVIIGAMIVAPLMLPIRGLAFGALAILTNLHHQESRPKCYAQQYHHFAN